MAAARTGTRTLLISTDPAPSLADVLIQPLSSVPRPVTVGDGVLHAAEIDARRAVRRWFAGRTAALERIALRATWLDREDVAGLLRLSLPGIDELAGLLEISRAGRSRRFDLVVVDTAPTGHTLRMLAMPEMLRRLARVFDSMQARHRTVVQALAGAYVPDESDALIEEIEREASALSSLLRDPRVSRVSWVTLPEPMAVEETVDAAATLSRAGIPLADVIVNRITPPPPTRCRWCDSRRIIEQRAIAGLGRRVVSASTLHVMARAREPRGAGALGALGAEIGAARHDRLSPVRSRRMSRWSANFPGGRGAARPIADQGTRLVFFGGKGGVGKTTCAAATALVLAADSPATRVLLLSADPAHSLGDVLGQTVGEQPVRVRGGPSNLRVRAIDAGRQLDTIRDRYGASVDRLFAALTSAGHSSLQVDAGQDHAVLRGLIDLAPPGIDELAAVIDVVDTIESNANALVIVDTAPTGHALRLLEMPAAVHDWTKALMSILLKYQAVGAFEEFGAVLLRLSKGIGRLRHLLGDADRTSFVAVTRAAALPRLETIDLLRRLEQIAVDVPVVIVNAVGRGSCRRCRSEAAAERRQISWLKKAIPPAAVIVFAPAEMPPPFGSVALIRWHRRWLGSK